MTSFPKIGIYGIFRIGTSECYVGQSARLKKRINGHKRALKRQEHDSIYLQRVYDKHGLEAFEFRVLQTCQIEQLNSEEQFWMDKLAPCYNHAKVAGSCLGVTHTDETKEKHRLRMLGNKYRKGLVSSRKGAVLSPETKARISESKKGVPNLKRRGMLHSEETKLKISLSKKGKPSILKGKTTILKGIPWSAKRRAAEYERRSA